MLISIPSILRAQFTADLPVRCYVGPHVIAVEGKPRRGFAKVYMLRLVESQDLCLGKLYPYYTPPICMHAKSPQSCPTLCDPMDHSLPGSSVHGILQARIPEWVAMPFSRGSSQPRDGTRVSFVSCTGRQIFSQLSNRGSRDPMAA